MAGRGACGGGNSSPDLKMKNEKKMVRGRGLHDPFIFSVLFFQPV